MAFALANGPIAPPKRARHKRAQTEALPVRQKPRSDAMSEPEGSQGPDQATERAERLETQPLNPDSPRRLYEPLHQPKCQCARPVVHRDLFDLCLCVWCGRSV